VLNGVKYGLAAVCAVVFPFTFFFRIYYSGPVLVVMLVPITWILVVGKRSSYSDEVLLIGCRLRKCRCSHGKATDWSKSWYNGSVGALTDATWGWSVAWRRFACAVIGVTAAWIFSCRMSPDLAALISPSSAVLFRKALHTPHLCSNDSSFGRLVMPSPLARQ